MATNTNLLQQAKNMRELVSRARQMAAAAGEDTTNTSMSFTRTGDTISNLKVTPLTPPSDSTQIKITPVPADSNNAKPFQMAVAPADSTATKAAPATGGDTPAPTTPAPTTPAPTTPAPTTPAGAPGPATPATTATPAQPPAEGRKGLFERWKTAKPQIEDAEEILDNWLVRMPQDKVADLNKSEAGKRLLLEEIRNKIAGTDWSRRTNEGLDEFQYGMRVVDDIVNGALPNYIAKVTHTGTSLETGKARVIDAEDGKGLVVESGTEVSAPKKDTRDRFRAAAPKALTAPEGASEEEKRAYDVANRNRAQAFTDWQNRWKPELGGWTDDKFKTIANAPQNRQYVDEIRRYVREVNKTRENKLDENLVIRQLIIESGAFSPSAVSGAIQYDGTKRRAAGIGQFFGAETARYITGKNRSLQNPMHQIDAAIDYMNDIMDMPWIEGNQMRAMAAYHDGPGAIKRLMNKQSYHGVNTISKEGTEYLYRIVSGDQNQFVNVARSGLAPWAVSSPGESAGPNEGYDVGEETTNNAGGAPPEEKQGQPAGGVADAGGSTKGNQEEIGGYYDEAQRILNQNYSELERTAGDMFSQNPALQKKLEALIAANEGREGPKGINPWAAAAMGFMDPERGVKAVETRNAEIQKFHDEKTAKTLQYKELILENQLKNDIAARDWRSALKTQKALADAQLLLARAAHQSTAVENQSQRETTMAQASARLEAQREATRAKIEATLGAGMSGDDIKLFNNIYTRLSALDQWGQNVYANNPSALYTDAMAQFMQAKNALGGAQSAPAGGSVGAGVTSGNGAMPEGQPQGSTGQAQPQGSAGEVKPDNASRAQHTFDTMNPR